MSLASNVVLGRDVLATVVQETTFNDETQAHAAGDSFKFLTYSVTPNEERVPRRDIRTSRDEIEVLVRNRTNEWNCSMYLLPRGTTTPPDANPYFTAALGTQTIGGSDVQYTYAATPPSVSTIWTGGNVNPVSQTKLVGQLVEEMTLTIAQGDEPKVEFSGIAARCMRIGGIGTIASGATNTVQTIGSNEAYRFDIGTVVQIGADTNLRITDRSLGSNTITLASSITTLTSETVRPYTPWSDSTTNLGGSPIASWNGSLTLASASTWQLLGAKITNKNNWLEHRQQFSQTFADASPGHREVTGTLMFRARQEDLPLLMHAQSAPAAAPGSINPVAVTIALGTTATGRVQVVMPKVVLDFTALQVSEAEDATFEIPFRALSTLSSGVPQNDALSLTWD